MNLSNCSQTRAFMDDAAYWRPEWIDLRIPAANLAYDTYPNFGYDVASLLGPIDVLGKKIKTIIAEIPGGGALVVQLPPLPSGPEFQQWPELEHQTRIPQSGQVQRGNPNPLYRDPGYTQNYSDTLDCAPGMVTQKARSNQNELWGPELDDTKRLVLERPMPSIVNTPVFPEDMVRVVPSSLGLWLLAGLGAWALLKTQ